MLKILNEQLGEVKENVALFPYMTLRTHAKAKYFYVASSREDLIRAVSVALELGIDFFLLGGGSNTIITHEVFDGLIIRNLYMKKEVKDESDEYVDLFLSSGYPMARVVKETVEAGWSGFEYHLGLPGTIGGAMYMNSKWAASDPTSYTGDNLLYAWVLTKKGDVNRVDRDYFQFAYDYSTMQKTGDIFLEGVYRLAKDDPEKLMKIAKESFAYRKKTQPHGVATAGCFFQNISQEEKEKLNLPTTSAGYLIDKSGLKGLSVGDYVVSDIHANFIINRGKGNAKDLKNLLEKIENTIKEQYGVKLKREVVVI